MNKKGISLIEIMLAMGFLLTVVAPLMVGMSSSAKATSKADRTTQAINIACAKMNMALSFPFGVLESRSGLSGTPLGGATAFRCEYASQTLVLGPENIASMPIRSELLCESMRGNFTVPIFDPQKKVSYPEKPGAWGWKNEQIPYDGLFVRYTLTVYWSDFNAIVSSTPAVGANKAKGIAAEKFYKLVSYKADIRGAAR